MSVKLKATYETEIFANEDGYVTIKQPDTLGGDDAIVVLSAAQLPVVIRELQALYDDRGSWESDGVERTDD
jgi:hypothetical protein